MQQVEDELGWSLRDIALMNNNLIPFLKYIPKRSLTLNMYHVSLVIFK